MKRKTHKDHKKDYSDALLQLASVQARIGKRAEELCRLHPDAPIGGGAIGREFNKLHSMPHFDASTETYLEIIKHVEEYNERKSNIKQSKINF